jgi:hypothetical protein
MCDFLRAMKQKHKKAQSVSVAFGGGRAGRRVMYIVVTTENSVLFESRKTKFFVDLDLWLDQETGVIL